MSAFFSLFSERHPQTSERVSRWISAPITGSSRNASMRIDSRKHQTGFRDRDVYAEFHTVSFHFDAATA
jgi:hypothetical protein